MAAKRRKTSTKSKKTGKNAGLAPGVGREIVAIILVAVSILLIVGFFNAGGSLTATLLDGLFLVFGLATYSLPALLLFLAWRLFVSNQEPIPVTNYVGLVLILVALAGLFHIGIDSNEALAMAEAGKGGGFTGYLLSKGALALLNVFTASIIFIALILIGLVLALNVRFTELLKAIKWRSKEEGSNEEVAKQLEQNSEDEKMTINAKVPLETDSKVEEPVPEPEVLTASSDPDWKLPPLDLLDDKTGKADAGKPEENAEIIKSTLASFGIEVTMDEVNIGPTVTQYTLRPASGVRLSKISELSHNLELALAAHPIRIEAPIPGKSAVGIEIPNRKAAIVRLRELLESDEWKNNKSAMEFAMGRDIGGAGTFADLGAMPHLLIAGSTGSGKSIMINSVLMSLLYRNSPANLKMILVDPKRVELKLYDDIPHLLAPVITEPDKCISALKWATSEMERRYRVFAEEGKRNIGEYNTSSKEETMPYIVVVIDELADLMSMAAQEVEGLIVRLAQKARATGIHLVLSTQSPRVNVITGLIKANIPARIALATVSQVDSRTILDQAGAEKLLGKGDLLYLSPESAKTRRIQGVFLSEKEVKSVTDYLRNARQPDYNEEVLTQDVQVGSKASIGDMDAIDDSLFMDAAQLVIESRKASASLLQRRLRIGYARAARLLDMLEDRGIVSSPDGSRPREVLADSLSEVTAEDASPES